jgi:hypothetical protein
VAQAVAETRPRKERLQALGGAVKAVRQDAPDPICGFLLRGGALELPLGLSKGHCTGVLRVAEIPDDAATDDRGEVHVRCQAVAVFFIR